MGKTYERIDGRLRTFIEAQPLFFTATAPLSTDGTVNLSPKGLKGSFAVLDELLHDHVAQAILIPRERAIEIRDRQLEMVDAVEQRRIGHVDSVRQMH